MKGFHPDRQGAARHAVVVQGVILRGSLVHGEHQFQFPVLLSRDPDLKTIVLAYLAPPLLCYTLNRFVVRPLWKRHRLKKVGHTHIASALQLSGHNQKYDPL